MAVPDALFGNPRLAEIYDALHVGRDDLVPYLAVVAELNAARVLDLGCGTGTFALLLAERGVNVIGVDPAVASLDVARRKPGAGQVRWLHGDGTSLPPLEVDLAVMTGNVAQAIVDPAAWRDTLVGLSDAIAPGGHLVFETRVPAARAWDSWTPDQTAHTHDLGAGGRMRYWLELLMVEMPLVTFRSTYVFDADGATLTSDSTLRFREVDEIEVDLIDHGFIVEEVRDAPDRPGREHVIVAVRQ